MSVLHKTAEALCKVLAEVPMFKELEQYQTLNEKLAEAGAQVQMERIGATDSLLDMLNLRERYGANPQVRLYSDQEGVHVGDVVYSNCVSMQAAPVAVIGIDIGTCNTAAAMASYVPVQIVVFEANREMFAVINHGGLHDRCLFVTSLQAA